MIKWVNIMERCQLQITIHDIYVTVVTEVIAVADEENL